MNAYLIPTLLTTAVLAAAESAPAPESPEPDLQAPATRFLADDLDGHLVTLKRRLAINKQERGPFGLFQVPGKTPIVENRINKMIKKTPFTDYIDQVELSVVNVRDQEFLVGARIFRLGQVFPIVRGTERISVRVEKIASNEVAFRNMKTGEIAKKSLNTAPRGVTAEAELNIPGIVPLGGAEAQPLRLDSKEPPALR